MSRWPQLPHKDYPWLWIHQNLGRQPRWIFPNTLTGNGLWCPRLNFDNFEDVWPLLSEGDTTFVNREYRERTLLYEQVLNHRAHAVYSGKHGAVDYVIIETPGKNEEYRAGDFWASDGDIRLSDGERILGVLHLYHLSHERLGYGMSNPFVGIQLVPDARGAGVADRAMDLLERFVTERYEDANGVTANIKFTNERSLRFFKRRGYIETDKYEGASEAYLEKMLK